LEKSDEQSHPPECAIGRVTNGLSCSRVPGNGMRFSFRRDATR